MNKNRKKLTYKQAKRIVIRYVQAFLLPYEPADSEDVMFYFPLIPIIQEHPDADINFLGDLDDIFAEFVGCKS